MDRTIPEAERELREALAGLLARGGPSVFDELDRDFVVTPYDGAYGQAGTVIALNGSPPRVIILTLSYRMAYGDRYDGAVIVLRRPIWAGSAIEIHGSDYRYTSPKNKRRRVYHAVFDFLEWWQETAQEVSESD